MNERLRNQAWMARENLGLLGIKPNFSKPNAEAVAAVLEPYKEELILLSKSKSERIKSSLIQLKRKTFEEKGIKRTPRRLTSIYINAVANDTIEEDAFVAMQIGLPSPFILLLDLSYGASMTVACIGLAEDYKQSGLEGRILETVDSVGDAREADSVGRTDIYLDLYRRTAVMAEILNENLTGKRLVAEVNKHMHGKPNRIFADPAITFQIPEFVRAGSDFARKAYETIYPIAASIK